MTYTYAVLDVPPGVYETVRALLAAASYQHAFHTHDTDEVIDMHGIALRADPTAPPAPAGQESEPLQPAINPVALQRDKLRAALVGLVGASTRTELEQMEIALRVMPGPAEDKAVSIDAIHALLATTQED